jgi:predicted metal-binding membrane protein
MLVAMMPPLLSIPLMHVYRQSLSRRRWRAVGLFLLGYAVVWIAAGGVLIPIAVTIQALVHDLAFTPAILGCVVALIWQGTPVKQLCLNACHRLPPLAACGLRADADDVLLGLSHARWCVGACWALMLCTIMIRGPLHWAVMFAITLFLMFERSRAPRRPRWLAAFVPATPIVTRSSLFSRGAP